MSVRQSGFEAYWDGLGLHQNPETGVARAFWINGWERARDLDNELNPELGFAGLPPREERPVRPPTQAKLLFMQSRAGLIRFVPSDS